MLRHGLGCVSLGYVLCLGCAMSWMCYLCLGYVSLGWVMPWVRKVWGILCLGYAMSTTLRY